MDCFVGAENRGASAAGSHKPRRQVPVLCFSQMPLAGQARSGRGWSRQRVCNTAARNRVSVGSSTPDPLQHAECYLQTEPAGKGKTSYLAQSGRLPALGKKSLEL